VLSVGIAPCCWIRPPASFRVTAVLCHSEQLQAGSTVLGGSLHGWWIAVGWSVCKFSVAMADVMLSAPLRLRHV